MNLFVMRTIGSGTSITCSIMSSLPAVGCNGHRSYIWGCEVRRGWKQGDEGSSTEENAPLSSTNERANERMSNSTQKSGMGREEPLGCLHINDGGVCGTGSQIRSRSNRQSRKQTANNRRRHHAVSSEWYLVKTISDLLDIDRFPPAIAFAFVFSSSF